MINMEEFDRILTVEFNQFWKKHSKTFANINKMDIYFVWAMAFNTGARTYIEQAQMRLDEKLRGDEWPPK